MREFASPRNLSLTASRVSVQQAYLNVIFVVNIDITGIFFTHINEIHDRAPLLQEYLKLKILVLP